MNNSQIKTYESLEIGWKLALSEAWKSFVGGTIPIGAVILNENDDVVSVGRNMIFEEHSDSQPLCGSSIAHAEINAIAQINRSEHPDIRKYTLYSTTEPCILCFGAIVMGNIRNFKYAVRDNYAGFTGYKEHSDYVKSKNIKAIGPDKTIEPVQIALQTYYELEHNPQTAERFCEYMAQDCFDGVAIGKHLFADKVLREMAGTDTGISEIFDFINKNRL
ncbi:MAG: nucleoside deaminase [Oscillospiraceae bacterium]|jgi:tRNA(Arg) A34 adenosine deaminase TadA|nr:nucleoside deaminase [Oscillospiraceae bacterium]